MRTTCSVYVDAGYLLSASATRVTGTSLRNGVNVNFPGLVKSLITEAEGRSGMPLLRVHWYDSARNGVPDMQQERIGELAKVKLRLGRFGVDGQQKGVDLRIGLDLVAHARNAASDVFYLISGDDDLTEAVEEAQVHGVQVVVLAVPGADDRPHGVARHLVRAADELALLPSKVIDDAVTRNEKPTRTPGTPATPTISPADIPRMAGRTPATPPTSTTASTGPIPTPVAIARRPAPTSALAYTGMTGGTSQVMPGYDDADLDIYDEAIDAAVRQVWTAYRLSATEGDLAALMRGRPSIPSTIDRALLIDISDAVGVSDLPESLRHRIRARFWDQVDT